MLKTVRCRPYFCANGTLVITGVHLLPLIIIYMLGYNYALLGPTRSSVSPFLSEERASYHGYDGVVVRLGTIVAAAQVVSCIGTTPDCFPPPPSFN